MSRDLAELVAPVFAADERVRFAYLFGSVAAGRPRPGSDVDLAVSVQPRGTLVDDARLHDARMRHRVVGGRPVYSRDDVARVRHRAAVGMEFLDFRPYYEEYLAAVHARARAGRLSRG